MNPECSIVIPVRNRAGLTRRCLDAILEDPPGASIELIVVDDASEDSTPEVLASYGAALRVVSRPEAGGFAAACNGGAALALGTYLVFLNNDTIPLRGWLDALVLHAQRHPEAAAVGSKLLFPNGRIQHAGVMFCQDANPRHLYAGFPSDHPAVNKTRPLQAVTAACMLVLREAFEQAGGFDEAFHNCFEDVDLCLRLREHGYEVHYCHESVLYHLESVSRGRPLKEIQRNAQLLRDRWRGRIEADDLATYVADGLLRLQYWDAFPFTMQVAPELASVHDDKRRDESERLLDAFSRQIMGLLTEVVRLTAYVADLEESGAAAGVAAASSGARRAAEGGVKRDDLLQRAREIEIELYDLQAQMAMARGENGSRPDGNSGGSDFEPSEYLGYRKLVNAFRGVLSGALPGDARVLVVSRGDDALLQLDGNPAWHFPQEDDGTYAGHYPADSEEAIAHLEALRERGAQYLAFPRTAFWWLDRYEGFGQHVRSRYPLTVEDESCLIFALR
jgi:GT2 family glycosyltransferase